MRPARNHTTLKILAVALLAAAVGFAYAATQRFHKEYPVSNETLVKASIQAGVGNVNLARGKSSNVVELQVETDQKGDLSDYVDYSVRGGVGYLNLNTTDQVEKKKHSIHITDLESNTWNMLFSDAVPLSFEIELGLGSGKLDFTGLRVNDLTVSAGASSVEIRTRSQHRRSATGKRRQRSVAKAVLCPLLFLAGSGTVRSGPLSRTRSPVCNARSCLGRCAFCAMRAHRL